VTRAEEFEGLRPLLFAIAYRILGSVSEAEDAVQETWLRYETSPTQPTSTKAFLSAVVTRISIDVLRSARLRREEYVGQWFPEPLLTDPFEDPARSAELADSVSMAALLLLERLTPLERSSCCGMFGFGFPEVASAVGRSDGVPPAGTGARHRMDAGRPGSKPTEGARSRERFFDAFREGRRRLRAPAADVQMLEDGGGKAPQWARGIIGAENVAACSSRPRLVRIGAVVGRAGERPAGRDLPSGRQGSTPDADVLGRRIQRSAR
jgi:RNA polymerase sigma-70 factor (ECF subfamily)